MGPMSTDARCRYETVRLPDCVQGPGYVMPNGYTRSTLNGKRDYAHRNAYRQAHGPIPAGFDIDHLCRNRACVNASHLEAVPHRTNLLRGNGFAGQNARKTVCAQGHQLDEQNTYLRPDRPGRLCRTCRRGVHQRAAK